MSETNPERRRKPRKCPKCKSVKVLRIFYGMPSPEAIEDAKEDEIIFAGCCTPIGGPTWRCDECVHEGGKLRISDFR